MIRHHVHSDHRVSLLIRDPDRHATIAGTDIDNYERATGILAVKMCYEFNSLIDTIQRELQIAFVSGIIPLNLALKILQRDLAILRT